MVGAEDVDKVCGHEASTALQQVQLTQGKHILEVFVHLDEARNDADLIHLTTNRIEEHCENALTLLSGAGALAASAGTGQRQGRADAGAAKSAGAIRIALVVADFNPGITNAMEAEALRAAEESGMTIAAAAHVPGVFDVPLMVQQLVKRFDVHAVCVYGAIVRGETDHDQVIGYATAKTLQELSLQFRKPITLGIAGPGMTEEQGMERAAEYGRRAVEAAAQLLKVSHD